MSERAKAFFARWTAEEMDITYRPSELLSTMLEDGAEAGIPEAEFTAALGDLDAAMDKAIWAERMA